MTTSSRFQFAFATLAVVAASTAQAQTYTGIQDAIPTAVGLTGTVKDNGWYNLTASAQTKTVDGVSQTFAANTGYPTVFTAANAWSKPIASQVNTGGTAAALNKVANGNGTGGLNKFNADGTRNSTAWGGTGFGPYPAGDSLYAISFSNEYNTKGGTLGVFEANPVANLGTVVFQLELGNANGYDFYESTVGATTTLGTAGSRQVGSLSVTNYFPTLNLTFADNSTLSLSADFAELAAKGFNGTIPMPTGPDGSNVDEPIWINLYAFQWDLTSFSNVTSYNITFNVVEHTQTYAARLTQSDVFTQVVAAPVPEPQTYAMMLAGLGMMGAMLRRRKAQATA